MRDQLVGALAEVFAGGGRQQRLAAAGRANAITLAAMGLARPSTSRGFAPRAMSSDAFSRRITGPTCNPTRAVSGIGSVARARWYSIA